MDTARSSWLIPGAIILAGVILSIAIYSLRTTHFLGAPEGDVTQLRSVHPSEHIVGDPEAPITIVTYADIDSPYAKEFQQTMAQLMTEYGATGRVAWVYRHFPLVDQHRYSVKHAEAAECVASLGGPNSFWRFIDLLQANAPGATQFNPEDYPSVIGQLGLSQDAFDACFSSGQFSDKVEDDFANALEVGAEASPYSVLLIDGKAPAVINGSVPYATLVEIVNRAGS